MDFEDGKRITKKIVKSATGLLTSSLRVGESSSAEKKVWRMNEQQCLESSIITKNRNDAEFAFDSHLNEAFKAKPRDFEIMREKDGAALRELLECSISTDYMLPKSPLTVSPLNLTEESNSNAESRLNMIKCHFTAASE